MGAPLSQDPGAGAAPRRRGAPRRLVLARDRALDRLAVDAATAMAPVFAAMGWQWQGTGVPGEAQIAVSVRGTLDRAQQMLVRRRPRGYAMQRVSTGRYEVQVWCDADSDQVQYAVTLDVGQLCPGEEAGMDA